MKVHEKFDDKCIFFGFTKDTFLCVQFFFRFVLLFDSYDKILTKNVCYRERLCKYTIWILENFRLFTAFFVFMAKNRFSLVSFQNITHRYNPSAHINLDKFCLTEKFHHYLFDFYIDKTSIKSRKEVALGRYGTLLYLYKTYI